MRDHRLFSLPTFFLRICVRAMWVCAICALSEPLFGPFGAEKKMKKEAQRALLTRQTSDIERYAQ